MIRAPLLLVALAAALRAAGPQQCAVCHPRETAGYLKTGMANSIGKPTPLPGGTIRLHSGALRIASTSAAMTHTLERDRLTAAYDIAYCIGSGDRARSFLVLLAGHLFQSPATYYTARRTWDLSPGYPPDADLDFDRPIPPACLSCHAGRPRPVPFTLNTYQSPPIESGSISCDRCHGPVEAHLARPSRATIVNPARLAPPLRDAVCEQCHLSGEARIVNPGRQPWNFHPGEPLEETLTVYVSDYRGSTAPFKVVSHSEELAASRCARESGTRLWCGTCHDPHDPPANPSAYYRDRCLQCHTTASLASHPQPLDDCIACHMPRRDAYDGGHTAFTDHQILARPRARRDSPSAPPVQLRAWREPPSPLAGRNLGLAYFSAGERLHAPDLVNQGLRSLLAVEPQSATDTAVLSALGVILHQKGVLREAARRFARAAELEPREAAHRLNLGLTLIESGRTAEAIDALETATRLDPSLRDPYLALAKIYEKAAHPEARRASLERYLSLFPQSITVRNLLRH